MGDEDIGYEAFWKAVLGRAVGTSGLGYPGRWGCLGGSFGSSDEDECGRKSGRPAMWVPCRIVFWPREVLGMQASGGHRGMGIWVIQVLRPHICSPLGWGVVRAKWRAVF